MQAKPSRLSAILLTRTRFQTCTGLPGAVITCAEGAKNSCSSLHVVGPKGLGRFMNALASYSQYVLAELTLKVQVRSPASKWRACVDGVPGQKWHVP